MIKVGIFFGGKSREREISFAGGRTVYDNLDKSLFEAIPLFVDSLGKITLLDWPHIYKGTIRDFFPGHEVNHSSRPFQVYADSLAEMSIGIFRLR
jgi:D-alanine-D-alanine ligase